MSRRTFIRSVTGQSKPLPHQEGRFYLADFAASNAVKVADLTGYSRVSWLSKLRQQAYAHVRDHTELSLNAIGQLFGGRDHTTIKHGIEASQARTNR